MIFYYILALIIAPWSVIKIEYYKLKTIYQYKSYMQQLINIISKEYPVIIL